MANVCEGHPGFFGPILLKYIRQTSNLHWYCWSKAWKFPIHSLHDSLAWSYCRSHHGIRVWISAVQIKKQFCAVLLTEYSHIECAFYVKMWPKALDWPPVLYVNMSTFIVKVESVMEWLDCNKLVRMFVFLVKIQNILGALCCNDKE